MPVVEEVEVDYELMRQLEEEDEEEERKRVIIIPHYHTIAFN